MPNGKNITFWEIDILLSFFRKEEISINGAFIKMTKPYYLHFFKK